jgi:hypothetical protein
MLDAHPRFQVHSSIAWAMASRRDRNLYGEDRGALYRRLGGLLLPSSLSPSCRMLPVMMRVEACTHPAGG